MPITITNDLPPLPNRIKNLKLIITFALDLKSREKAPNVNVSVFPKGITPLPSQDSNPGPSEPDPVALTTRPTTIFFFRLYMIKNDSLRLKSQIIFDEITLQFHGQC